MFKKLVLGMLVMLMLFTVVACGKDNSSKTPEAPVEAPATTEAPAEEEKPEEEAPEATESLKGTIVITGSTSVDKIITDVRDEFIAIHPDVDVQYTGTGSSAGIKDAIAGNNNMGASSRELKTEENDQLESTVFAFDGIAVIVNNENEISNLTMEQLVDIYTGKITNWKDVNGADEEIFLISREESSGTRSAFEEIIKMKDAGGISDAAAILEGNGGVQSTVEGNKSAIGYVSFSFIDENIKALNINDAEPNKDSVKAGEYKLARPFILCYTEENVSEIGKKFLEFALSADGQKIVEKHGGIKVVE